MVEAFNGEEYIPYMVLSVKAGGTGLNLTSASHVIHFDRWWNPAVENQATDRAFAEITEEYHNELYGYIEAEGLLDVYKNGRPTVNYIKIKKNGNTSQENITMTEYIRHQIHHPENNLNPHFSERDLRDSIQAMREFIQNIGE